MIAMAGRRIAGTARGFVALGVLAPAFALGAAQDPAALTAHAERFLRTQTTGLPGKVSIEVQPSRATLPACSALDAFLPVGSRALGKTVVGVRCLAPGTWTVYLQARVRAIASYAATARPLSARHALGPGDVVLREGDLGNLPADVVTDPEAILGYRAVSGLAAGAPLRTATLRPPLAVQQGQVTRLVVQGPGFAVRSEGQALANAAIGERVRIKTRSGQVVSGIAQENQQVVLAF